MGAFDRFRGRGGRVGIEIGRDLAVVELKGDPPKITAAGHSAHAGYDGVELGGWLRRWLGTLDVSGKTARAVIVDGDVHHFLVSMPEMSDRERHLAAGAEVRKLAPGPAAQLAYSHQAVGYVEETGISRQKVLISAVDRTTLRNAVDTIEAAGLRADTVTTVPAALAKAAELLPPAPGGQAIAYLASGRSYLLVFQNGVLELVRDFVLRAEDRDFDPAGMAEVIAEELRRSFLFFGQRAHGASVERLVLAGPMSSLPDLATKLREVLAIDVSPFDVSARVDLGSSIDPFDQPALAVALGAASLEGTAIANLVPPEEVGEEQLHRFFSVGRVAAAVVLLLLAGWGLLALLNASVASRRSAGIEDQLVRTRQELTQARDTAQARDDHRARRDLLERRALETTLMGALLQRVGRAIPDKIALESIGWTRSSGPEGQTYWDAQLNGFVNGDTRSESQAIFNRFYAILQADPIVDDLHLVEPLVIGLEGKRVPPPLISAVQERLGGAVRGRPGPVELRGGRPGEVSIRTSLDDLPAFGPSVTSVGFKVGVQLKRIQSGGTQ